MKIYLIKNIPEVKDIIDNKEEKIIIKMKYKIIEEDQMIDKVSKIVMMIMMKKWV